MISSALSGKLKKGQKNLCQGYDFVLSLFNLNSESLQLYDWMNKRAKDQGRRKQASEQMNE